jgi:hypothetical protein
MLCKDDEIGLRDVSIAVVPLRVPPCTGRPSRTSGASTAFALVSSLFNDSICCSIARTLRKVDSLLDKQMHDISMAAFKMMDALVKPT